MKDPTASVCVVEAKKADKWVSLSVAGVYRFIWHLNCPSCCPGQCNLLWVFKEQKKKAFFRLCNCCWPFQQWSFSGSRDKSNEPVRLCLKGYYVWRGRETLCSSFKGCILIWIASWHIFLSSNLLLCPLGDSKREEWLKCRASALFCIIL